MKHRLIAILFIIFSFTSNPPSWLKPWHRIPRAMVKTYKISWYIHDKRLQILTMINSVYKSLNSQALLVDIIVDIIDIPFTSKPFKTSISSRQKPKTWEITWAILGLGIERLQHLFPSMDLLESMLRFSQRFFGLSNHITIDYWVGWCWLNPYEHLVW